MKEKNERIKNKWKNKKEKLFKQTVKALPYALRLTYLRFT